MRIATSADIPILEAIAADTLMRTRADFVPSVREDGVPYLQGFGDNLFAQDWITIVHPDINPDRFATLQIERTERRVRVVYAMPDTLTRAQLRAGIRFLVQQAVARFPNIDPANWTLYTVLDKSSTSETLLHNTYRTLLAMQSEDRGDEFVLSRNLAEFAGVI